MMRDRIAKSVFWIVWSRGVFQVVSFVATLIVMRLLSPADYGLMALAAIWTTAIAGLAELGAGAAIVQFRDAGEAELNSCFWIVLALASGGYAILYLAAPSLGAWFDSPALPRVLQVSGLGLFLMAVRTVPDSLLRRGLRLDRIAQSELVSGAMALGTIFALAWAGAGVWALVVGALVGSLVQSVMTFSFARWRPGLVLGGSRLREMIRYSVAALAGRVCWMVQHQADAFVLGKAAGDSVLGTYSIAKQLATLVVEKVSVAVNQIAAPVMAELQDNRAAMGDSLLRAVRFVAWTTFPVCCGLMIIAPDLVHVILTDKWSPVVPLLYALCPYAMLQALVVLFPPVLSARYRVNFLFWYHLALSIVMPLSFWLGASHLGALGVALAWISIYPLLAAWLLRVTLTAVGLSFAALWAELRPPLTAAAAMTAVAFTIQWALSDWTHLLAAVRMTVVILVGAASYGLGVLGFGGRIKDEIREVSSWLLRLGRVHP